jgi:general secretion pathway protein G
VGEPVTVRSRKRSAVIWALLAFGAVVFLMFSLSLPIMKNPREARIASAKIQMKELMKILEEYKKGCGQYPTTEQGLQALVHQPTVGPLCNRHDPDGFIKKVPRDPWDQEFKYSNEGKTVELRSEGEPGMGHAIGAREN